MDKSDIEVVVGAEDARASADSQQEIKGETKTAAAVSQEKQTAVHNAGIPNGGLQAWLQVLGAFFLWFNTW
jgi:hypothetical protein